MYSHASQAHIVACNQEKSPFDSSEWLVFRFFGNNVFNVDESREGGM